MLFCFCMLVVYCVGVVSGWFCRLFEFCGLMGGDVLFDMFGGGGWWNWNCGWIVGVVFGGWLFGIGVLFEVCVVGVNWCEFEFWFDIWLVVWFVVCVVWVFVFWLIVVLDVGMVVGFVVVVVCVVFVVVVVLEVFFVVVVVFVFLLLWFLLMLVSRLSLDGRLLVLV